MKWAVGILLAAVVAGAVGVPPELCARNCRADDRAFELLRHFEGYSPFIYEDAAGKQTIGFGHAIKPGDDIEEPLVGAEAEELLERDAEDAEAAVNRLVRVPLSVNQFDALTCFTFNLGAGTLAKSSNLLPAVNAGRHADVPDYIRRYDKVRVHGILRVLEWQVSRREAEAVLYERGAP